MAKRSKDTLTGGTGDVNPQWLRTQFVTTTASPGVLSLQIPLPIQRLHNASGRAQIVEILKVMWNTDINLLDAGNPMLTYGGYGILSTKQAPAAGLPLFDGSIIDYVERFVTSSGLLGASSTGNSGWIFETEHPYVHDLTDGAGHGILVATDNIFLTSQQVGAGGDENPATDFSVQAFILYRFKDVSLAEYIGIVQSQQ